MRSIILLVFVMRLLFESPCGGADAEVHWPETRWKTAAPADVGMQPSSLQKARDYAITGGGAGYITRSGLLVMSWGDPAARYDLKSTTKSIGVTALGLAVADGKIQLDDPVVQHHPSFAVPPQSNLESGWIEKITIRHLATQTAGFEKTGGYSELMFPPGTRWSYSDGGPNWLAECVTLAYRRDVDSLLFQRVFGPLGIDRKDLVWRRNSYRPKEIEGLARREFGSGISANVDAMARIGYLYLRSGKWKDRQIIPTEFVELVGKTSSTVAGLPVVDQRRFGAASNHYGLLWWNNSDGAIRGVPRDAFWSWGLYDSLIVVIPSLDVVVARAGKSWKRDWAGHYNVLEPFLTPIVASMVKDRVRDTEPDHADQSASPYGASPVISGVRWAPAKSIIRKAKGSDNWPITWGDDDAMYTAFGDGRGFQPFVEKKLSMGLCRITGSAEDFRGINLRSPSAERTGGGASGPKVSSMLMVDGVLYMLVRNTGNSQIAWSKDRGRTWEWSPWRFETSFGYPVFLNFGRNYAGARDSYVYVYSHDSDSAYERADRMVLARVPSDKITVADAYEYFARIDRGSPVWDRDIKKRGAVFHDTANCYRCSVIYNSPLKRYVWCQTGRGDDTRHQGGLSIYDAPRPWGPWTTVFRTDQWDVGPGETSCFPTKWISENGREMHFVFSGNDAFSVRKATLSLVRPDRDR